MMNGTICNQIIFKTPSDMSYLTSNRYVVIIISLVASVFVVFTIAANMVVIFVILHSHFRDPVRNKTKNHQTGSITKWLAASSAVLDVIIGAVSMPLGVLELVHNGRWTLGWEVCRVRLPLSFIFSGILAYHVMCLSLDRYLAVCRPFLYKRLPTRTAYVMIVASWIVPMASVTVPVVTGIANLGVEEIVACIEKQSICVTAYNVPALKAITSVILYLPFIVTYAAYAFILLAVWRFNQRKSKFMPQRKPARSTNKPPALINPITFDCVESEIDNHESTISENTAGKPENQHQEKTILRDISHPERAITTRNSMNRKANVIVGGMIACCTISWLPTWVVGLIVSLGVYKVPYSWFIASFWMASSNAALNPVLFCLNYSVRERLVKLLCVSKHQKERLKQ